VKVIEEDGIRNEKAIKTRSKLVGTSPFVFRSVDPIGGLDVNEIEGVNSV
jgi:hypothetical protein